MAAPAPRTVTLTRVASLPAGSPAPKPLQVVGDIASSSLTAVPASFADLAAVRTYLNTLVTELKASPFFS